VNEQRIRAGGVDLAVRIDGEAGRPWLLVSNSLAADYGMWDDQVELLTRTHRVIRYDTRGHGSSGAPQGPYSFPVLVDDMVAVLDHFGVERADVLALSLGGMTALGLALDHPGRAGRMIICDARADAPPPFVASWDQRIAEVRRSGMEAVVASTLERWFTPSAAAKAPGAIERARKMILSTDPQGYIGCAAALKHLNYLERLNDLRTPVLYVVGEDDTGAPKDAMSKMAERTAGSRLVVLPALAHVPPMENPGVFADAIECWLADAART
jgi:3-oxoadipate enol-lactonase